MTERLRFINHYYYPVSGANRAAAWREALSPWPRTHICEDAVRKWGLQRKQQTHCCSMGRTSGANPKVCGCVWSPQEDAVRQVRTWSTASGVTDSIASSFFALPGRFLRLISPLLGIHTQPICWQYCSYGENMVRETRKNCSSHAPVGYRRFHEFSHLTCCSNTLQLSEPCCSGLYCAGSIYLFIYWLLFWFGFDVSAIAELQSGKERELQPSHWSLPPSHFGVYFHSQMSWTPHVPTHSLCPAHTASCLQTLFQQEFPFYLLAFGFIA